MQWVCVVVGFCSGGLRLCNGFVQLGLVWWMVMGGESWRLGGCWVRCWLDFNSGFESMWVPLVVAGFESVVVVWVLVGLLNRWWLWVVKSVWDGFESLVFGSSNFSLFVGFG